MAGAEGIGMNNTARLLHPDRHQHVMEDACLDRQLSPAHRARQVWAFVQQADVSVLDGAIGSRAGRPGAPAIAPRLLLALWLYACLDGVGSARELARLCEEHVAYRWLCGRVGVNHHTLSDFRAQMGDYLDGLLSTMIAALVKAGVVEGSTICQDGTKIRASAGSGSFRRESTLQRLREEAAAHVAAVKAQSSDQSISARVRAARQRAAREREERVELALKAMEQIKQVQERARPKRGSRAMAEPRASTTDSQARVMKIGYSGKHAAYNAQFATDVKSRAIVGVQVTPSASDYGLSDAMRQEVQRRTGVSVFTHITDAGYMSKATIEIEENANVARIMPLPTNKKGEVCAAHQPGDGPGVRRWRERMGTDEAKALMRQRSGIAETPHAELKTLRALASLPVRGINKAKSVILLGAIVYNLVHFAGTFIGMPMHPL